MRVLHVINSLAGSGGAEQGLVREITHFDPSVVNLVVRLFENDDLEARLTSHGVDVVWLGLRSSAAAWSWPEAARRVRRLIRSFRPDIVHTSLFTGNLVGQLAATGTGVPVLSTLTLTGDERLHRELQPGADTRRAAFLRRVAARIGRQSHVWYRAISEDAAETNCESMGIDRAHVTVIPRGVPMVSVEPDRSRFGLPETGPLIVNVGRQAAQKGQVLLLRAFRQIKDSEPDAHLAIAGREGDATRAIRQEIVTLGLEDSVDLLGYREDVDVLLASADLFMFSSLAEGLGTAVIEAMAAGVPVVAFDIPPVREATEGGRHAALVPSGNVEALARAGRSVLSAGGSEAEWNSSMAERHSMEKVGAAVASLIARTAAERVP